ncbi:MAG TPA: lipoyl(octanoyl) transferase LipB, partial [Alphaproteobacteria bacterium]|nr:lipoyl(octanoyl) transferase LipB [Alphaproteobacteria bacterium]
DRFPVFESGRGGQYTYHGPGQRVAYVMLDLRARKMGVRDYVCRLEDWIIASLARFGLKGERRDGRIGIWIERGTDAVGRRREDKIAAIGVRVRRWVSYHGIAINVEPDLDHFGGIVPCGIAEHGVTSLVDLGYPVTMPDLDAVLRDTFEDVFGGAPACTVDA